jgi:hypothetical protein
LEDAWLQHIPAAEEVQTWQAAELKSTNVPTRLITLVSNMQSLMTEI